jgi:rRNA processing protein Gar1
MGGLLVDFQGRPPRLGARIRISGGKIIGRVDTVIGPVGSALIHVHPLYDGIDARASVGSPVEIAPREQPSQRRPRGRHSGGNFRERGGSRGGGRSYRDNKGGGNRGRGPGGQGGRSYRDNKGGGNRGRGPNNSGRKTGNTGRRRDSGKSGRGNKRR